MSKYNVGDLVQVKLIPWDTHTRPELKDGFQGKITEVDEIYKQYRIKGYLFEQEQLTLIKLPQVKIEEAYHAFNKGEDIEPDKKVLTFTEMIFECITNEDLIEEIKRRMNND